MKDLFDKKIKEDITKSLEGIKHPDYDELFEKSWDKYTKNKQGFFAGRINIFSTKAVTFAAILVMTVVISTLLPKMISYAKDIVYKFYSVNDDKTISENSGEDIVKNGYSFSCDMEDDYYKKILGFKPYYKQEVQGYRYGIQYILIKGSICYEESKSIEDEIYDMKRNSADDKSIINRLIDYYQDKELSVTSFCMYDDGNNLFYIYQEKADKELIADINDVKINISGVDCVIQSKIGGLYPKEIRDGIISTNLEQMPTTEQNYSIKWVDDGIKYTVISNEKDDINKTIDFIRAYIKSEK